MVQSRPKKLHPISKGQYDSLRGAEWFLHNPATQETNKMLKGGFAVPVHYRTFDALTLRGYVERTGGEGNRLEYRISVMGHTAIDHYLERQKPKLTASGKQAG